VLSNSIKQKRKEKAGKWNVPVPKVRVRARSRARARARARVRVRVRVRVRAACNHATPYVSARCPLYGRRRFLRLPKRAARRPLSLLHPG